MQNFASLERSTLEKLTELQSRTIRWVGDAAGGVFTRSGRSEGRKRTKPCLPFPGIERDAHGAGARSKDAGG